MFVTFRLSSFTQGLNHGETMTALHEPLVPPMNSTNERESFSERLQQALKNAHYSPDSPTRLAREFNIRFEGRPITVHAARKWLVGEAIPTQEKLRMIAQWLGVPADWLRFGGSDNAPMNGEAADASARFESADVKLIADLQRLDEHHKQLAREFIRMLVRMNHQPK
jgi:transcriptional regulator with XRE-family HTH domain